MYIMLIAVAMGENQAEANMQKKEEQRMVDLYLLDVVMHRMQNVLKYMFKMMEDGLLREIMLG